MTRTKNYHHLTPLLTPSSVTDNNATSFKSRHRPLLGVNNQYNFFIYILYLPDECFFLSSCQMVS